MNGSVKKRVLMTIAVVFSIMILGVLMQIGGAYLVNAAVTYFSTPGMMGAGIAGNAAAEAAKQYSGYMQMIRSIDPRSIGHVVFVAPLVEEIVFRLIFLRAGKKVMPFWIANVIQAVLFGIYHKVIIQVIYGFVMGLMIGCVFYYGPILLRKLFGESYSLRDMPDSVIGVAMTVMLHSSINSAGLFLIPLFSADLPITSQVAAGTFFMLVSAAAVFFLYRLSSSDFS